MADITIRDGLFTKIAFLLAYNCDLSHVPSHMRAPVADYILFGHPVGDFLTALFSNDLKESFGRADDINRDCMLAWVQFMVNDMPARSQGAPGRMAEWTAAGGLIGRLNEGVA